MNKLYLHPITKNRFIPKLEYFNIIFSKQYEKLIDQTYLNKVKIS